MGTHERRIRGILGRDFFYISSRYNKSNPRHYSLYHRTLCTLFYRTRYNYSWYSFWDSINTLELDYVWDYFFCNTGWGEGVNVEDNIEMVVLLRLVIVEEFIHWLETGEFK